MAEPDPAKFDALMGRLVGDLGAAFSGTLVVLGDRLGSSVAKSVSWASRTTVAEAHCRPKGESAEIGVPGFIAAWPKWLATSDEDENDVSLRSRLRAACHPKP